MPRRSNNSNNLTDLELAVMRAIWDHGEDLISVEEIQQSLEKSKNPLAPPSVRTMLTILRKKGYLARQPDGRRHLYKAIISEDKAQQSIVEEVVNKAFDGSAVDLVAALVQSKSVKKSDLEKVKKMLADLEKNPPSK